MSTAIEHSYTHGNLPPRLTAVKPLPEYQLYLSFDNGEHRIFDARPLLSLKPFQVLASEGLFRTVRIAFGTVAWGQNLDYCPDTLYAQSVPAQK